MSVNPIKLSRQKVKDTLVREGLKTGDILLVHSSLRSVGPISGGADALIDGLLDTVGSDGILAMPAFNYTRPLPTPYFDTMATPSRAGALTEVYRKRSQSIRSLHPTHSVIAQGKRAVEFLSGHEKCLAFGVGSPLDRLAQAGGWVLLLGVTQTANSCIHVGESHAGVRKFHWQDGPSPVAKLLTPDGRIVEHPIDCSSSCSAAFNYLEYPLRRKGMLVDLNLGDATCLLMRGKDVIATVIEVVQERADALLCRSETCRPCLLARKYISENLYGAVR